MARKAAQDKWDAENMASITVRVKRELLDNFKATCAARGDAVNGVLRKAMGRYTYGENGSGADLGGDLDNAGDDGRGMPGQ